MAPECAVSSVTLYRRDVMKPLEGTRNILSSRGGPPSGSSGEIRASCGGYARYFPPEGGTLKPLEDRGQLNALCNGKKFSSPEHFVSSASLQIAGGGEGCRGQE